MKVALSIGDFALPVPRVGSIDVFSGFGRGSLAGMEIHQQVQELRAKEFSDYKAEYLISHSFEHGEYTFEISGRMDGLFESRHKIEEIKSSFNIFELFKKLKNNQDQHPYCLQLKTYGYFYYLQTGKVPHLNLHLVSSRNGDSKDLTLNLDIAQYEVWLTGRLDELVIEADLSQKRIKRRKLAGDNLIFPFENTRANQTALMDEIKKGMSVDRPMLIQAPTGLGKTLGVLHPTLEEALKRGQKVIYVTPKNSQHSVAEDAVERLQDKGAKIKSLTITAKSKICMKNEPLCNPDFCEYAKDHYTKVAKNDLLQKLSKKRSLKIKTFVNMAEEFEVCPFELQLDAAQEADTVICDYNYVFAPRSSFGRITGSGFAEEGKPNLVIDEAHNLPARALDYYSPSLSVGVLEKLREEIEDILPKFKKQGKEIVDECIAVVKSVAPPGCEKPLEITPPAAQFMLQDEILRQFLSTYLSADVDIQPGDPVLRLSFYWSEFASALEFVSGHRKEFFTTFNPNPATIKITCCDASEMLKGAYANYSQIVGFSATLKPFEYYGQLSGFDFQELKTSEFSSPFPRERRKLLVIPQISSKYSEREKNYPKIAETIKKIIELKKGNYFAFFPSFDFMEKVLKQFDPGDFEILKQERYMRRNHIENLIEQLKLPGGKHIVFAVQGGVLSEGMDYPGDMAIGAFVVGPPLPIFDLEREKMREYYQTHYEAGFDYAYTYPAMAKAVQAAGRVIRSENDAGIIVLMDSRFTHPSYVKSMPQDWFDEHVGELVSQRILNDISQFWEGL